MKKYLCILAGAALFVGCEQKTETVAPAAGQPASKTENNTTIVNPSPASATKSETHTSNTMSTTSSPSGGTSTETSTSTTTSTPSGQ